MKKRKYFLGPACWPQWLLRWLPFAIKFNKAAKRHDDGYGKGGDKHNKQNVDYKFFKDMLKVCKYNPFAYLFAIIYFLCVDIFGFIFFNYTDKFIPKDEKTYKKNRKY